VLAQTLAAFVAIPTSTRARSTRNTSSAPSNLTESLSRSQGGPGGKSKGLSIGAKAGVGVGAGVGALVLLGLGYFLAKVRQWKRAADAAKRDSGSTEVENSVQAHAPAPGWVEPSSPQNPAGVVVQKHEVDGNMVNEAPNQGWLKSRNAMP